jgi:hypothetical protein
MIGLFQASDGDPGVRLCWSALEDGGEYVDA